MTDTALIATKVIELAVYGLMFYPGKNDNTTFPWKPLEIRLAELRKDNLQR